MNAPIFLTYRIGITKTVRQIAAIALQNTNQQLWPATPSSFNVSETEDYVFITNLHGDVSLTISFLDTVGDVQNAVAIGPGPAPPFPPPTYPADFEGADSFTQGNWIGVYGSKGYLLAAYSPTLQNVESLPAGVTIVNSYNQGSIGAYGPTGADPANSTLAPENPDGGPRSIGCYYSTYSPTFSLDIIVETEQVYMLTVYFIDWDHRGRQQIVSLMDFETKNVVAPTQFLPEFTSGVYLSYTYNKSARIRVSNVRGDNAVLTALFFD